MLRLDLTREQKRYWKESSDCLSTYLVLSLYILSVYMQCLNSVTETYDAN